MKQMPAWLLALALFFGGCAGEDTAPAVRLGEGCEITVPAGPGSLTPYLHVGPEGQLYLSWQERLDTAHTALRFAIREGGGWSTPHTITTGTDWFVNWADFPAFTTLGGDTLAAYFLQKTDGSTYAYAVRVVRSIDGGKMWSQPLTPHRDGTPTEHGFVSLVPGPNGRLGVVWLDGRKYAGAADEMTLRFASITAEGMLADTTVLDGRTCDCCQTAAARASSGLVVAYRDRSPDEIRDIAVVRRVDGQWTEPTRLHTDGWHIAACPVNGPAMDAEGARVAVAWFTRANGQPRVKVSFSNDGGATFGGPVRVDAGRALGRVDLALLKDGTALVSWMARTGEGAALRVRPVRAGGQTGQAVTVASMHASRASGFPQMAVRRDSVYFVWTDPGTPSRLQAAVLPLLTL